MEYSTSAASQVKFGMVPGASKNSITDFTALEREAHEGATVVDGEDLTAVAKDLDRPTIGSDPADLQSGPPVA